MRLLTKIVRRATRTSPQLIERPKANVRGRSPRARLREEAFSMLG